MEYSLYENHLTADPGDFKAVVQPKGSKGMDHIIQKMIGRGSTVTKAETYSVFEEYSAAIEELLKEGYSINTPLFNLSPSIRGVFNSQEDNFNPAVHQVKINVTTGVRLKEIAGEIKPVRVKGSSPKPDIDYVFDFGSDTRNDELTPGNIASIKGSRLKFDPTDEQQGVFLIAADNTETKAAVISRNKPGQVDFLIPQLAAGDYKLEVRAKMYQVNSMRIGSLDTALSVV